MFRLMGAILSLCCLEPADKQLDMLQSTTTELAELLPL